MDFRTYLTKLQSLPDNQKKIVLWTIVAILAIIMGIFWLKISAERLSRLENSIKNTQFPQIEVPNINQPAGAPNNK